MRFARFGLALCILIVAIPSWGKQPPQSASTTQPASDPQAVAVVQAAITDLGGATAIGQAQSWTFQGQLEGPLDNGDRSETIDLQSASASIVVNGVSRPPFKQSIRSIFLPALLAFVLLQESQDSNYSVQYGGTSTLDSKPVTIVIFSMARSSYAIAQTWIFDNATGLPTRVGFKLPAILGQSESFPSVVDLSDYRSVSGVLYPFRIVTSLERSLPETLILQSVSPTVTTPSSTTAAPAGGAQ